MFRSKKSLLFLIITIVSILASGCESGTDTPDLKEDQLIGSWILTRIIASYPDGKKDFTPEQKSIAMTISVNSDKTFRRVQTLNGTLTDDSGTWTISGNVLMVSLTSGSFNFPCQIDGNKLQASTTMNDPDTGAMVPVIFEFTKQ